MRQIGSELTITLHKLELGQLFVVTTGQMKLDELLHILIGFYKNGQLFSSLFQLLLIFGCHVWHEWVFVLLDEPLQLLRHRKITESELITLLVCNYLFSFSRLKEVPEASKGFENRYKRIIPFGLCIDREEYFALSLLYI